VELFNEFFERGFGWEFISRFGHVLSGITWIGLLYFFNFVQTPAFAQMEPPARSEALRKVTFRALWWFRYAALFTFLFGLSMVAVGTSGEGNYFEGPSGASILTGMLFGVTMFLNVWGVIWPNQKIIIGSAERVAASGGEPDPRVPDAMKRAARASRANTFMSIPMLWYMVFTSHLALTIFDDVKNSVVYWIVVLLIWAYIEGSALGLLGGFDSAFNKLAFDDHRRTIIGGFITLVILHFIGWELILGS
jgi:uncharacterized membrane protein